MKMLLGYCWLLSLTLPMFPSRLAALDLGSICGVVQDANGTPIAGAILTLSKDSLGAPSRQTPTNEEGKYCFSAVPAGEFRVAVTMNGFTSPSAKPAMISATVLEASVNFALVRANGSPDMQTSPTSPPALKFEAAGIRGLIDPGGYSAPAGAAASTGLIKGMADLKRSGKEADTLLTRIAPCSEEPRLRAAEQADPRSASSKQQLGNFYIAHGQPTKGIPLLEQALSMSHSESGVGRDLAIAYLRTENFDAARKLLITLPAKPADFHQLLARADEGSGMFRQAAAEYKLAVETEPNEEDLFGVGYELILAGSPADAATSLQAALQRYPGSVTLLIGLGTAEYLQSHTVEGLRFFLQAADLQPTDPRPYGFLASTSALHLEESDRLLASLKRFHELAPENADASYYYALSLWNSRAGKTTPAELDNIETLLRRALSLNPNFSKAHFQLAALYFERGNYQEAAHEFEQTLQLAPDNNEAHFRLANSYKRTGRPDLSEKEMRAFEAGRAQKLSQGGSMGINIEQFISVIHTQDKFGEVQPSCLSIAE